MSKERELLEASLKLNKELFQLVSKIPYEKAIEIAKIEAAMNKLGSEKQPVPEQKSETEEPQTNAPGPEKPRRRF